MKAGSAALLAEEIEATDSYRSACFALREEDSARPLDVIVVSQIKLALKCLYLLIQGFRLLAQPEGLCDSLRGLNVHLYRP